VRPDARIVPRSTNVLDIQAAYQKALRALQTTISGKTRAAPKGPADLSWEDQFERLRLYLDRLGMTEDVDATRAIHVAGTKGKGSTCAFAEHIMRECGVKTGLYTSPHLVDVRERFRIDGKPVSKKTFTREFWWLFNACRSKCADLGGPPAYFRFLTLLGFRIFAQEKVECAILEVGLGGRLDATNLVRSPTVCGVTSLGLDHVEVLGDTLAKIAAEKAGIFKPRVPAFTSPQIAEAMEALQKRADEIGVVLQTAPPLRSYARGASSPDSADEIELGLAGAHQKQNAALAVRLVREWAFRERPKWGPAAESLLAAGELPETFRSGLAKTEWWGRAQVVPDPESESDEENADADATESFPSDDAKTSGSAEDASGSASLVWYLDGAHTEESMAQCAEWFCDVTTERRKESGKLDATAKESATQTGDDAEEDPSPAESDGSANAAASPASPATPATPLTPEPPPPVRVLLFNCMEERDPRTLLAPLAKTLRDRRAPLTHPALFAPAESSSKGLKPDTAAAEDLAWQNKMVRVWDDLARKHPGASLLSVAPPDGGEPGGGGGADGPRDAPGDSVPEPEPETSASSARAAAGVAAAAVPSRRQAGEKIRSVASEQRRLKTGRRVHVLVAGSLYLVGDMLRVLGRA
jgi:folylpolyglutamate synthase